MNSSPRANKSKAADRIRRQAGRPPAAAAAAAAAATKQLRAVAAAVWRRGTRSRLAQRSRKHFRGRTLCSVLLADLGGGGSLSAILTMALPVELQEVIPEEGKLIRSHSFLRHHPILSPLPPFPPTSSPPPLPPPHPPDPTRPSEDDQYCLAVFYEPKLGIVINDVGGRASGPATTPPTPLVPLPTVTRAPRLNSPCFEQPPHTPPTTPPPHRCVCHHRAQSRGRRGGGEAGVLRHRRQWRAGRSGVA